MHQHPVTHFFNVIFQCNNVNYGNNVNCALFMQNYAILEGKKGRVLSTEGAYL